MAHPLININQKNYNFETYEISKKTNSDSHLTDECMTKGAKQVPSSGYSLDESKCLSNQDDSLIQLSSLYKDKSGSYYSKISPSFNDKFYDTRYVTSYTSAQIPSTSNSCAEDYRETDSKTVYNIEGYWSNSKSIGNQYSEYTTADHNNYFGSSSVDSNYSTRDQVTYYNSVNIEKNVESKQEYNAEDCFSEYVSESAVFTTNTITTINLDAEHLGNTLAKPIPTVSTSTRSTVQTTYCSALLYDLQEENFPWTKTNEDTFSHIPKVQNPKSILIDESSSLSSSIVGGVGVVTKRKGPLLPTPLPIPKWMLSIPPQLVVPPGPLPLWSGSPNPPVPIPSQTPINIPPPPLQCNPRNQTNTPLSRPTTRPFNRNPYKWVRPNYFRRGTGSHSSELKCYGHYTNDDSESKHFVSMSDNTVLPPGETSIPNLETSLSFFNPQNFSNQEKMESSDLLEYSSTTESTTELDFPQEAIRTYFGTDFSNTSIGQLECKTTLEDQPMNPISFPSSTVPLNFVNNDEKLRNSDFEFHERKGNVDQKLLERSDDNNAELYTSCTQRIVSSNLMENEETYLSGSKFNSDKDHIIDFFNQGSKGNNSNYSCKNLVNITQPDSSINSENEFDIYSTLSSDRMLKLKISNSDDQKQNHEKVEILSNTSKIGINISECNKPTKNEFKLKRDYKESSAKKLANILYSKEGTLSREEGKNHKDCITTTKLASSYSNVTQDSVINKVVDTKKFSELTNFRKDECTKDEDTCNSPVLNSNEYKNLNKGIQQKDKSKFDAVSSGTDSISYVGSNVNVSAGEMHSLKKKTQTEINSLKLSSLGSYSINSFSEIQQSEVGITKKADIKHSKGKKSEVKDDTETINTKKNNKLEGKISKNNKNSHDTENKVEVIDFEKILADIYADDISKPQKNNSNSCVSLGKSKTWINIFKKPFTVSHNMEMQFTLRYFRTLFVSSGAVNSDKTLKTIPNITVGLVMAALIEEYSEKEILKWLKESPSQKAFETQMFIYRQLSYYLMNGLNDYQETLYWKHLLNYIEYQPPSEQYGIWENVFGSDIPNIAGLTLKGNLQVYKTHSEDMCKESKKCPVPNHYYHPYPRSTTNTKVPRTANRRKRRKLPFFYSEDHFFTQQTVKDDSHNLNSKIINTVEPVVKSEHETTFSNEYFRNLLKSSGIEKTTKSLRILTKESKLTVGMVMAAMKDPDYETIEIIKWITNYIHKTLESPKCLVKEYLASLYLLLKKQLLVYKSLSCYLMNQVPPEDIKYWERILSLPYHIKLKENMAFWEQIFGNLPNDLGIGISSNCLISVNAQMSAAVKELQVKNEKVEKDSLDIQLEKEMDRIHSTKIEPVLLNGLENSEEAENLSHVSKPEINIESKKNIGSKLKEVGNDCDKAVDYTSSKSISFVPRVITTNVLLASSTPSHKKRCSSKFPKLIVKENLNECKLLHGSDIHEYSSTKIQIVQQTSSTGKGIAKYVCPASLPVSIPLSTTNLLDHKTKEKEYGDEKVEEKCVNVDIGTVTAKKHDKKRVYDKGYFKAFSVKNNNKVNKMTNFVDKISKIKQIHGETNHIKNQEQISSKLLHGSLLRIEDKNNNTNKEVEKIDISSDINIENETKNKEIYIKKKEHEKRQEDISKDKINKEIKKVYESKSSSKNSKSMLVSDNPKLSQENSDLIDPKKKSYKKNEKYKSKSKNEQEETKKRKRHTDEHNNVISEDENIKALSIETDTECIKEVEENKEMHTMFNTLEILNLDLKGDHLFDRIIDIYRGVRIIDS
ncbi:unnamed protein product, partial [Meganyctiphanes norvegica]